MKRFHILAVHTLALVVLGCSSVTVEELTDTPPIIVEEDPDGGDERIIIVDQTGKEWDVTHALRSYGMRPELFQFGVGPHTIPSINEPRFILPGQRGYPTPSDPHLVVATNIAGDSRAYRLDHLNSHEVVNDVFGDAHVAVAW